MKNAVAVIEGTQYRALFVLVSVYKQYIYIKMSLCLGLNQNLGWWRRRERQPLLFQARTRLTFKWQKGGSHLPDRNGCTSKEREELPVNSDDDLSNEMVSGTDVVRSNNRDPFRAAGDRLDRLLSGIGDGEDELLDSMLMDSSNDKKISLALLAGGLVSVAAYAVCLLVGLDPAGGARFSLSTLQAVLVGGLAAIPIALFKESLWTDRVRSQLPFLEDLQQQQLNEFKPVLYNLSGPQCALVVGSEVIPTMLILFPTFAGGVSKVLEFYRTSLTSFTAVPETIPPLLAVTLTSLLTGISKVIDKGVSPEEYDVIKDAFDNSDRYYTVMNAPGVDEGKEDEAFKTVAITWLARRQVGARFAGAISAFEVFYLGLVWLEVGDLAAPLTTALAMAAVDFINIRKELPAVAQPSEKNQ